MAVHVKGAKELEALLKRLPERVAKRVVNNGLRAGARIIRDDAKARVPVDTGELQDSITVATVRGKVKVGFKPPASRRAHLTEFGTENQAAQPFMRPALDSRGTDAIKKIGEVMGKGVEKEARAIAGGKIDAITGRRR